MSATPDEAWADPTPLTDPMRYDPPNGDENCSATKGLQRQPSAGSSEPQRGDAMDSFWTPGDQLPNHARVLAFTDLGEYGIVLALFRGHQPFMTWEMAPDGTTREGHGHESLDAALEEYHERVDAASGSGTGLRLV